MLVPVLRAAGLPLAEPFRRARRGFATECARPRRGIDEAVRVRWMGHVPRHVTDAVYVHDFPMDEQRELIARLEIALTAPADLRRRVAGARRSERRIRSV